MENTLQNDPAFEKVSEISVKDTEISKEFINKALELLREEFNNNDDFTIKHGFLSLSKLIIALAQSLCETSEEYVSEIEKAQNIATNKVMPAILPKFNEDETIEDGYDMEDLSIRRIMMTMGSTIDYVFWRNDLSQYSDTRAKLEEETLSEELKADE